MAKNTSVLIGDHFEEFIGTQVKTGRFTSASEVVRAALRAFEREEGMKDRILEALEAGEASGFIEFDPADNLQELHRKHLDK
jgi:antitoxin ParD1/3/4